MPASIFDRLPTCNRSFSLWNCRRPGSTSSVIEAKAVESSNPSGQLNSKDRERASTLREGDHVKGPRGADKKDPVEDLPDQSPPPPGPTRVFPEPSPKERDPDVVTLADQLEQAPLLPGPTKVFRGPSDRMPCSLDEVSLVGCPGQNLPSQGPPATFQEPFPLKVDLRQGTVARSTTDVKEKHSTRPVSALCTATSTSHALFPRSREVISTSPCRTVCDFSGENEDMVLEYTAVRHHTRSCLDLNGNSLSPETGSNAFCRCQEPSEPTEPDASDNEFWEEEEPEAGSTNRVLSPHGSTSSSLPVGHHPPSFLSPPDSNSQSARKIPDARRLHGDIPDERESSEQSERRGGKIWTTHGKSKDVGGSLDTVATKDGEEWRRNTTDGEETSAQATPENVVVGKSSTGTKSVHQHAANETEHDLHAVALGNSSEKVATDAPQICSIRSCLSRLPRNPDPTRVKKTVTFSPSVSFSPRQRPRSAYAQLATVSQLNTNSVSSKSQGTRGDSMNQQETKGVESRHNQSPWITRMQQQCQNGSIAGTTKPTPSYGRHAPTMYELFTSHLSGRQAHLKTDVKRAAPSDDVATSSAVSTLSACKPSVRRTSAWRDDLFMLFGNELDKTVTQLRKENRFTGLAEFDLATTLAEFMLQDRRSRIVNVPSPVVGQKLELMADMCYIHTDASDKCVKLCKNRESRLPVGRDILWVHTAFSSDLSLADILLRKNPKAKAVQ